MTMPELTRCVKAEAQGDGRVLFGFEGEDGNLHEIVIRTPALRSLAPLMLHVLQSQGSEGARGQPAALTSARVGYMDDGTPLLGLGLNGIEVAVAFPTPDSLENLAHCIAEHQAFGDAKVSH